VRAPDDLDAAFRALTGQRAEAVIVLQDGMLVTQRRRIVALASSKAHPPDIHSVRDAVVAGGMPVLLQCMSLELGHECDVGPCPL
jgi:hypothetical protein